MEIEKAAYNVLSSLSYPSKAQTRIPNINPAEEDLLDGYTVKSTQNQVHHGYFL